MSTDTIPLSNINLPQRAKIHKDMNTKENIFFELQPQSWRQVIVFKKQVSQESFSFKKLVKMGDI
jgi:hypothetical protein